jgi:Fe-S cluster assembly ATPase SufC
MPVTDIVVETPINKTFRVLNVASLYDLTLGKTSKEKWHVNLPIEDKSWKIGLIVGASGSGKTTIAKNIFGKKAYHEGYKWDNDKSILDNFPEELSIKDITKTFTNVGFSSTPNWIRPYFVLSTGEKFRTELARILLDKKKITIIDEFTSVVDRTVAKIASAAFHKAVSKTTDRQFVAVSCHYDIIEWLQPDWVYDTATGKCSRRLLRRPEINLEIYETHHTTWEMFKRYHYLSSDLNISARCMVALYENQPVAFRAYLPVMGRKGFRRGSRVVVLPDFQGVGIGKVMLDFPAHWYFKQGFRVYDRASHPAVLAHWRHSPNWICSSTNKTGASKKHGKNFPTATTSGGRITTAVRYVEKVKVDYTKEIKAGEKINNERK